MNKFDQSNPGELSLLYGREVDFHIMNGGYRVRWRGKILEHSETGIMSSFGPNYTTTEFIPWAAVDRISFPAEPYPWEGEKEEPEPVGFWNKVVRLFHVFF